MFVMSNSSLPLFGTISLTDAALCFFSSQLHTQPFKGPFSGTTQVSRYQKGKTNLDFTEARDSEWQWHQLGHMQVCTSLQTGNHASTPPLSFLQAGCPFCRPTNSVKASEVLQRRMFITFRSNCHSHVTEGCTFCKSALSRWVRSVLTFWHQYRSVLP